ncbi:MAG: hypothetical protein DIU68_013675 [Chloroflexota bacterium]|nr:MAG: hypothetical protein DIU68_06430 [Chloroflexota bacterium]
MNSSRLVGLLLTIAGVIVAVIAGLWIAQRVSNNDMPGDAAVLAAGVFFIPVALLVGFGIYMYVQGGARAREESEMQKQRQLLDILRSRGQVSVNNMALEMNVPVSTVQNMVHQLVGLQVFSGYVNWKDGVLYSAEASELRKLDKCKNCGGEITLAGKGIVACKYCGTEYFLS